MRRIEARHALRLPRLVQFCFIGLCFLAFLNVSLGMETSFRSRSRRGNGNDGMSPTENAKLATRRILKGSKMCSNDKNDKNNLLDPDDEDTLGFTCMGITPKVGWENKKYFANCLWKCSKEKHLFVKCCHDLSPKAFEVSIRGMYTKKFFSKAGCDKLVWPAYYACASLAVESGPERAREFVKKLGRCPKKEVKAIAYCKKYNAMTKKYYSNLAAKEPDQQPNLRKWFQAIRERDKVCDQGIPASKRSLVQDHPPVPDALSDMAPNMPFPAGIPPPDYATVNAPPNIASKSPHVATTDDGNYDSPKGPAASPTMDGSMRDTPVGSRFPLCARMMGRCVSVTGKCEGQVLPDKCNGVMGLHCCVQTAGVQMVLKEPLQAK